MACLAMSDKERIAEKTETIRKLMEERDQLKAEIERLKKQEAEKKCCRDCEYYGACHNE